MDVLISDISKTYNENRENRVIFKDMSVRFSKGKFFVIIGRSGVGKSSLLNLISGIDVPDNGKIHIDNISVSDLSETERTIFRRKHIGFIYQFFNLIPVLTVLENITLICELDSVPLKEYKQRADYLLEKVGLFNRRNDYLDKLSGGEQQRVAIVRSLINEPKIILADEPTGNLDLKTGNMILEMISDLTKHSGKTIIMVTHSLEAADYADQIFRVSGKTLIPQNRSQIQS